MDENQKAIIERVQRLLINLKEHVTLMEESLEELLYVEDMTEEEIGLRVLDNAFLADDCRKIANSMSGVFRTA